MQFMDFNLKKLTEYRLFRPLNLKSNHYNNYKLDKEVSEHIIKWTSNIKLGGYHYNLDIDPESIFQIPSNRLNRFIYVIPITDKKLIKEVVLCSKKTKNAQNGCGAGNSENLDFIYGNLILKRVFIRKNVKKNSNKTSTNWVVEDRYYIDVYIKKTFLAKENKIKQNTSLELHDHKLRLLRVYPDSTGCIEIPHFGPNSDINKHNESIKENVPEYFQQPDDIIMNWHELTNFLKLENTGIYAICNFIASEIENGNIHETGSFFYGKFNDELMVELPGNDISAAALELISNPNQELHPWLTMKYNYGFLYYVPGFVFEHITINTNSNTKLFHSPLSDALIQFLIDISKNSAVYLGDGLFILKVKDATSLAAGNNNWGSGESSPITIETEVVQGERHSDISGGGPPSVGVLRTLVDLGKSEIYGDKIASELRVCRSLNIAECKECASNSTGKIFHTLGTAADFVDVVGGILLCIFIPPLCVITLPVAGNAAKRFWDNTFGGYDYEEDICYGIGTSDTATTSTDTPTSGTTTSTDTPTSGTTTSTDTPTSGTTTSTDTPTPFSQVNVQLPDKGPGYYHDYGNDPYGTDNWGTKKLVECIQDVGREWFNLHPNGPRIGVNDLSLRGGGPFGRRRGGHQRGLEVDIRPFRLDQNERGVNIRTHPNDYDPVLTQELVNLFRMHCDVMVIFFNDPNIQGVRPLGNDHYDHLHIRLNP